MKKQRQKQITIDAVVKVQNFLRDALEYIESKVSFSMTDLAQAHRIDKMIATLAVRNGYFNKGVVRGEFEIGENYDDSQTGAKKLIEMVRLSKIDSSLVKAKAEIGQKEAAQANISAQPMEDIPKIKPATVSDIKAIFQELKPQQQSKTLFDEKEKEFDDKLKIACAVASGVFSRDSNSLLKNIVNDHEDFYTDSIVKLTNCLYDKLKKQ